MYRNRTGDVEIEIEGGYVPREREAPAMQSTQYNIISMKSMVITEELIVQSNRTADDRTHHFTKTMAIEASRSVTHACSNYTRGQSPPLFSVSTYQYPVEDGSPPPTAKRCRASDPDANVAEVWDRSARMEDDGDEDVNSNCSTNGSEEIKLYQLCDDNSESSTIDDCLLSHGTQSHDSNTSVQPVWTGDMDEYIGQVYRLKNADDIISMHNSLTAHVDDLLHDVRIEM